MGRKGTERQLIGTVDLAGQGEIAKAGVAGFEFELQRLD